MIVFLIIQNSEAATTCLYSSFQDLIDPFVEKGTLILNHKIPLLLFSAFSHDMFIL